MIELRNAELHVQLLDPLADAARLGPRFCWGGFIWQVQDGSSTPLLSGPEWPAPNPTAFNGQGLPESFRHRTLDGRPLTWRDDRGIALGAGELRARSSGEVQLVAPSAWTITRQPNAVEFTTEHAAVGFHYALQRRIELAGREVRSFTRLANRSASTPLGLEWFAHPFFPLVDGQVRAEIASDSSLADNPGFTLQRGVLTQKRRFVSVDDGHMERGLRLPAAQPFHAKLAHPVLGGVEFETSFAPSACVIWGNDRTFSFEPYLALQLAPGESRDWSLCYRFGASSGISAPSATSRIVPSR